MSKNRSDTVDGLSFDRIKKICESAGAKIHFVGIGGVSMYSLARLVINKGAAVSGSDRESSLRTERLSRMGAQICIGHSADNVVGKDLVVYSHAIDKENPELACAERLGIPSVGRDRLLGALMLDYRRRIGVSGSHGKSTTVAILDRIFSYAGANPTVLSGAELPFGDSMREGGDELLIYEACEYRDSFLRFSPTVALGLNLELDHTDYFESLSAIKASFAKALGRASDLAIICGDDPNLRDILSEFNCRQLTFGFGAGNDYRYFITNFRQGGFDFSLSRFGGEIYRFSLNIPGSFNVMNAAAAITVAVELGIDFETISSAISDFPGIARRLQYVGDFHGSSVYYDYAHHPTEIRAAIDALKSSSAERIAVVFKPHTYSRTKALWEDFCGALSMADSLIVTEVYAAREEPIEGISGQSLADAIDGAIFCHDGMVREILSKLSCDKIILMGAGDMEMIKNSII